MTPTLDKVWKVATIILGIGVITAVGIDLPKVAMAFAIGIVFTTLLQV